MIWTQGQSKKLNVLLQNRHKLTKLAPARQVVAIRNWILHNTKNAGLSYETFPTKDSDELRVYIKGIAEFLGCYVDSPIFQVALQGVTIDSANQYAQVDGNYGTVPSEVVRTVCDQYSVKRDVILAACNAYASPQGSNGVKTVEHKKYKAELKILAMRDERIYADAAAVDQRYLFDDIAKHL